MSLLERVRPNIEAAPWVIAEIEELEYKLRMYNQRIDRDKLKIKELKALNTNLIGENIKLRDYIIRLKGK